MIQRMRHAESLAGVTRSISWTREKSLPKRAFQPQAAYDCGDQAGLTDSGGRPSPRSYGRGCHPCYVPGVFRFDKFRFDDQLTQFLQEAVRFTVVVAVVEALVILVAFVLASR